MNQKDLVELNTIIKRIVLKIKENAKNGMGLRMRPDESETLALALDQYTTFVDEQTKDHIDLMALAELARVATGGDWTYEMDHSHQATVYANRDGFRYDPDTGQTHWPTHGLNLFGRLELDSNGENNLRFMTSAVRYVVSLVAKRFPAKV